MRCAALFLLFLCLSGLLPGVGHLQATADRASSADRILAPLERTAGNDVTWTESSAVPRTAAERDYRSDPHLKPGFPVYAYHSAGSFHAGQAVHVLVMNLDGGSDLEIVATGLATGPLYAWKHDGTLVPGFPIETGSAAYPAGHELLLDESPGLAVGFWNGEISVFDGAGGVQPGWPRAASNYVSTPPSVYCPVLTRELGSFFLGEEDWHLHGYQADGLAVPGWPVWGEGGQERHTPAIADIDGDGIPEILTCSGSTSAGVYLFAYKLDGSLVSGFPVNIEPQGGGVVDAFPAVGDLDDDGAVEIVVVNRRNEVRVYSGDGSLKGILPYEGTIDYSSAPALADLDGDWNLEVVVQTNEWLNVLRHDGSSYPGWPVSIGSGYRMGNSSPVVGDVTGDGYPDIVITVQNVSVETTGQVRAYDRHGSMLSGFPKVLPLGEGGVPAIADLLGNGRNHIIVVGSYWDGVPGYYPKVWVYDLQGYPSGRVEWGQFMSDSGHTAFYEPLDPSSVDPGGPAAFFWAGNPSPNPFSSSTTVRFDLPRTGHVTLRVFDAGGRLVRTLLDRYLPAERHSVVWDGKDDSGRPQAAGVYYYSLAGDGRVASRKLTLIN